MGTRQTIDDIAGKALEIRAFEETALNLFQDGAIKGTTHACIGQEVCAVCLYRHAQPQDAFFSNHRCHGHFLAYGGNARELFAEMLGRPDGICGGKGGSQHICWNNFFSNGIQGGMAPVATGYAFAARCKGENAVAVCHLGDGTMGQGVVYEAFNLAAMLKVPVLFVLENNGIAQTTRTSTTTMGRLMDRGTAFGLHTVTTSDRDIATLDHLLATELARVRGGQPSLIVIDTNRLCPHSKRDDTRPAEELARISKKDPLGPFLQRTSFNKIYQEAKRQFSHTTRSLMTDTPFADNTCEPLAAGSETERISSRYLAKISDTTEPRICHQLNRGLREMLSGHPDVYVLGQDIADPYGGAFKVTRGLSTVHPEHIIQTPISEAGTVGLANGMALNGLRPVVEIMFSDFTALAADQIINQAAKYYSMYNGRRSCPVTIRLVSGAGRGYGPTHSQCLENLFCGIPGLRVISLSRRHDAANLLKDCVLQDPNPTLFAEYKTLYDKTPIADPPVGMEFCPCSSREGHFPPLRFIPIEGIEPDATVVTFGAMTALAEPSMHTQLLEHERCFDYFVLTQLWPLDLDAIIASVQRTRRLLVLEESVAAFGVSSAVTAAVAEHVVGATFKSVGAKEHPIPSAKNLEQETLPTKRDVLAAINALFSG